jgi:NADH-quinone oxidoreductase subunit K
MNLVPVLMIAAILFATGLAVVLIRRELLFVLMGIEVMFNGSALTAVAAGQHWDDATGQVMTLFLMTVTGSELAVTLVLVLLIHRLLGIDGVDRLRELRDTEETL